MKPRKEVIEGVLEAFLGEADEDLSFDVVLEDIEIEILTKALDEALEKQ